MKLILRIGRHIFIIVDLKHIILQEVDTGAKHRDRQPLEQRNTPKSNLVQLFLFSNNHNRNRLEVLYILTVKTLR